MHCLAGCDHRGIVEMLQGEARVMKNCISLSDEVSLLAKKHCRHFQKKTQQVKALLKNHLFRDSSGKLKYTPMHFASSGVLACHALRVELVELH